MFFRKKKVEVNRFEKASDSIILKQLTDDDCEASRLVDKMLQNYPILVNCDKINVNSANKFLAFFSGACYASNALIVEINPTTFLFAKKELFQDGSLDKYVLDLKN